MDIPVAVNLSPVALRKDFQCRSFAERKSTIAAPDGESDCHWETARTPTRARRHVPLLARSAECIRTSVISNDRHDFWAKAAAWQGRRQLFSTAMHAVRILERMKLTFPDRNGFVGHLRLRGAFCGASGSSRNPPGLEIAESADFCWPTGLTAQGISTDTSLPRCARVSIGQRLLRSLCGGSWGGRGRAW